MTAHNSGALTVGPETSFDGQRSGIEISQLDPAVPQRLARLIAQRGGVPISELPPNQQLPAAPFLIAAYAFIWVALLAYLFSIWRRLGRVEQEMRALSQRAGRSTGR